MKRLFPLCLVVFFISSSVLAQDNQLTPWTIVEKCLPTPTIPDDNWTFDGEILLSGWGGIHAVRASLDTPYVIYWGNKYGAISPDGQWILDQHVHTEVDQLTGPGAMGRYHFYYGDIIAKNLSTGQKITFDWESYISFSSRPYLFGPADPFWLDSHHFAAFWGTYGNETKIGDVDTAEIIDWPDISLDDYEMSVSPDQTRMISYSQLYQLPDNTLMVDHPVGTDHDFRVTTWTPDSSMFADVVRLDDQTYSLTIFDRDGNPIATPFIGRVSSIYQWSPMNDYLAFSAEFGENENSSRAFMMDMREQVVYDLCMDNPTGLAWSPNGIQFATIFGGEQQPVVITAVNDWKSFIAAYHTGWVLSWRSLE